MFPKDFIWGAATSAYQVEGATHVAGRGASVWDMFCATEGKVHGGHTGDLACDHYHRFASDVEIMAWLGLKAYRLSIAWPRVIPGGTGAVSREGLAFYDRLVDRLLEAGIEPWVTLFHWDLPLELHYRGGWLNAESPHWFEAYAAQIVDLLSDRVSNWMTINEPQIFVGLGYGAGTHAPGLQLPFAQQLLVAHRALLAHGRAVTVIRGRAKKAPTIGWAPVGKVCYPATNAPADIAAARLATVSVTKKDCWNNTWFADPVCLGHYPEDALALFGKEVPAIAPGDMELISQPLDFYGVNIYSGEPVQAGVDGGWKAVERAPGSPQTAMGWPVSPESLDWGPRFLYERYKLPIVITENGMASHDAVSLDGQVHDPTRIDFLARYLMSLHKAILAGVDVRGYFQWSLLDNFEWAEGYRQRFGIVYVDYETQKRTPKDSAHWYQRVISTNGALLNAKPRVAQPASSKVLGV
jgi:beta-glucosidase